MFAWLALSALAQLEPPVVLPAEVADARALGVNPAGLAFSPGSELWIEGGVVDGRARGAATGLLRVGPVGLAAGLGYSEGAGGPDARFGLGVGGRRLAVGLGYALGEVEGLSVGLQVRPLGWLAVSAGTNDLLAAEGPRPYDLGLALRPLERLTLSTRLRLRHGQGFDHDRGRPDWVTSLEVQPIDGLFIGLSSNLHLDAQVQIGLSFDRVLVRSALGFTDAGVESSRTELSLTTRPRAPVFSPAKVAIVELAGELTPPPTFDWLAGELVSPAYGDLPLDLARAAASDDVVGLWVKIGELDVGFGKAAELRRRLLAVAERGKRVDCSLGGTGDLELFVASACTSVVVLPPTLLRADGVSLDSYYFREALERLGIEASVTREGEHKTAPEGFVRDGPSVELKATQAALLAGIERDYFDALTAGRKISEASLVAALDRGVLTATEAKAAGLVDEVLYPDELEGYLERVFGRVRYVELADALRPGEARWSGEPKIAVLSIDRAITGGPSLDLPFGFGRTVGAETLVPALDELGRDPRVRAVVLRLDSPGGDAVASELIARAVEVLAQRKVVVASFGDVAASGAYYVAAPSTVIFAEPTTLTGSIGVFSLELSAERLLARLGITRSVTARGRFADHGDLARAPNEAERARSTTTVSYLYRRFLDTVARGRRMPPSRVRELAGGRVYTGRAALEVGLVDRLGGLIEAIEYARQAAGLERFELEVVPSDRASPLELVGGALGGDAPDLGAVLPASARALVPFLFSDTLAVMPYLLAVD